MMTTRLEHLLCRAAMALIGLLTIALLSGGAWAADMPPASSTSPLITADDFYAMIQALKGAARTMAPYLLGEGFALAGAFFTWSLTMTLLRINLSPGDPAPRADMGMLIIKLSVVLVLLANWMTYGVGPSNEIVKRFDTGSAELTKFATMPISTEAIAVGSFDTLVNGMFKDFGGGGGKEKLFNVVGESWKKMWEASAKRDEIRSKAAGQEINPINKMVFFLDGLSDKAATFIVALVVGLLAIILMVVYLFVIYWGDIAALAGMFMGPIMVPGLLFSRTEFLFDAWIKFMISAGFYKLIAAWTALVTMATVSEIQRVATNMYGKYVKSETSGGLESSIIDSFSITGGFLLSIVMTVLYMIFAILLMWKVGDLVRSLMAGMGSMFASANQAVAVSAGKPRK